MLLFDKKKKIESQIVITRESGTVFDVSIVGEWTANEIIALSAMAAKAIVMDLMKKSGASEDELREICVFAGLESARIWTEEEEE